MEILSQCMTDLDRLLALYDGIELSAKERAQVAALKEEVAYDEIMRDLHSIISDCKEGAERIRDIVQNLRTFSRLDEAELKRIDLHEGIESTLRLLSRYYTSPHISLQREYGELPPVECYAGQLNQVWMNLLVNAAQALSRVGGSVRISTRREGEMAVVQVSDTGCGIPPENLGKIFDPFFTTKPVGEGTGLGLSIAYGIITRHGGQIKVESQVGHGSTFKVFLPIRARSEEIVRPRITVGILSA